MRLRALYNKPRILWCKRFMRLHLNPQPKTVHGCGFILYRGYVGGIQGLDTTPTVHRNTALCLNLLGTSGALLNSVMMLNLQHGLKEPSRASKRPPPIKVTPELQLMCLIEFGGHGSFLKDCRSTRRTPVSAIKAA